MVELTKYYSGFYCYFALYILVLTYIYHPFPSTSTNKSMMLKVNLILLFIYVQILLINCYTINNLQVRLRCSYCINFMRLCYREIFGLILTQNQQIYILLKFYKWKVYSKMKMYQ